MLLTATAEAVAAEVARALGAPLDVFLVRKLGVPGHEELAFGAIAVDFGRLYNLHSEMQAYVDHVALAAAAELDEAARAEVAEREREAELEAEIEAELQAAVGDHAGEQGPKDTAQMFPGEATALRARFDRAGEYVWHCHILEHEENDMMRPVLVG